MKATTHRVRFREFEFVVDTLELWRSGEAVHLPPKPSKTLALLIERAGSLVTREELQASVWSGTVVEFNQSLNTYVRLIRSTLGDDAESPTFIETVPRRGYRFVADVRPAGASDALSSSRRATGRMAIVAAVVVLALGVWAGVALNNASASPARIAILPLQVLGADEADRLFADGLSEELITTLAGLAPSRMEVIGRASSVAFGRGAYGIEDVGRVLGADYALEGSVRPAGDGYRVSARLVRTSDHVVVWSGQYDRDSGTLSAQEWLASHLASIVAPAVSVDSIAGLRREPVPQARVRWLMAQHLLNRGSPDEAARSLPLLEGVTDVDPAFALARVSLGRALMQLGRFDEADTALAVAFRLEPALPYAHLIRGQLRLRQWRLDDAERDLEYAVEHATGEGRMFHSWAYYLALRGRHDEARRAIMRAEELDPISQAVLADKGLFDYWARRPAEAARQCEEALLVALPERRIQVHRCLLHNYEAAGDLHRARLHALAVLDSAKAPADVRRGVADATGPADGLRIYREWGLDSANFLYAESEWSAYARARAYAVAGKIGAALDALEEALGARDPSLIHMGVEPRLDAIRDHPRFQAVARALGL